MERTSTKLLKSSRKREEAVPEMTRYQGKDIDEITGTAE
jgi:hypothetical protein